MQTLLTDTYRDWKITIQRERNMCSNFRFDITDPSGKSLHTPLGGETAQRAMARAKEMIDLEISFSEDE